MAIFDACGKGQLYEKGWEMLILGVHREPWHDTGAAVLVERGGKVELVSVTQERLDRVKDSRAFPSDAIEYCLDAVGAKQQDVDLFVSDYVEVPVWNKDRLIKGDYHPLLHNVTDPRVGTLDAPVEKVAMINHHQAHAASAFYASPFDEAAILVVDGRGSDKETQSLYVASRKDGIRLLEKSDRLGLGLLYATITVKIGFGILNEGKTMGLAPYGYQLSADIIDWSKRRFEGIHTDYSRLCGGRYELHDPLPPMTEQTKARLAYEVQEEIERGMLHLARHARQVTGAKHLCIAGGVGLNSVANYRLLREGLFEDVFIQPACSDTGLPLGCALHGYYQIMKGNIRWKFSGPYLGRQYSKSEIEDAINSFSGYEVSPDPSFNKTMSLLVENKVVGWFQGRSEIGPRSLGCRSILMSPCVAENKDLLNARVKHREAFRPFAPAVLEERAQEFFNLNRPSPYMLLIADVKKEKQSLVPAVTHVDGTARVQTVNRDANQPFYRLIELFGEQTGVPVLLNTSFNVAGEPIVESPQDAIRCFLSTGIDALLLEDVLLIKRMEPKTRG